MYRGGTPLGLGVHVSRWGLSCEIRLPRVWPRPPDGRSLPPALQLLGGYRPMWKPIRSGTRESSELIGSGRRPLSSASSLREMPQRIASPPSQ